MAKLITDYSTGAVDLNKISEVDKAIRGYIDAHGDGLFDVEIQDDPRWQVFFQLSELRAGIVSWYDFKPDSDVLEIGAGFGPVTDMLCKKCARVTVTERSLFRAKALEKRFEQAENLTIYAVDAAKMDFGKQFDYILLTGLLERVGAGSKDLSVYADYLKKISGFLKPDGKLLVAVENRYGLKYFCGSVEPHTNKAFDGINGYPSGTKGYSFSRKEMEELAKMAGFAKHKFYYPLPDYKLPQLIYTDEYQPERNLKERLLTYNQRNDTLLANEAQLYDDVISGGAFPFMANSFLVEYGQEGPCGQVIYSAVSTDRGPERSYTTSIYEKDSTGRQQVVKRPIYAEGKENALLLQKNMEELAAHGIPVVEQKQSADGSITMPYITHPTLSNYLKELIRTDVTEFEHIIDRIYEYILKSSEESTKENALCKRLESDENKNWGPILRKAYMELIPLNCFYNPEQKEFLYFDQEFVRENYPAKYVLFRAIHYIYCFTPNAEQYYPKQKLIEKYEMTDTWDDYLEEEKRFLDEVRNHETYKQFYRWHQVDHARMLENAKRLESQGQTVEEYEITDKMKRTWQVELTILDEIDRICKENLLTYYLVHGSLLGAVRHKGFIPWDDDLDIAMLRPDYDKFLEIAKKELKKPLSVEGYWNNEELFWGGHARIRNADTTAIEVRDFEHHGNQGIWVDILPLDTYIEDEKLLAKKAKRIKKKIALLQAKIYGKDLKEYAGHNAFGWKLCKLKAKLTSLTKLASDYDAEIRRYGEVIPSENRKQFLETHDLGILCNGGHRRLHGVDFAGVAKLEFASRVVPAPIGYEEYLTATMGKNYMKFPPKEERKPKHRGIMDPSKPYGEYQKLFEGMFDAAKGKTLILFGSGFMFEDYMTKYGDKYRPAFLADNDKEKWDKSRMGIPICRPEDILKVPEQKRHVIICSYYYKEIGKQLEEMGIMDYKVYIQRLDWILKEESRD